MGRRGRKRSFWKRHGIAIMGSAVLLLIIALITTIVLALTNPYKKALKKADIEPQDVQWKKGILTLTFQGDATGILSCRDALNVLRAKKTPETVRWILLQGEEEILTGTVESVGDQKPPSSPRVETLNKDLTLLKLKYELTKTGISAEVRAEPTVGLDGKTVTVTLPATEEPLQKTADHVLSAIASVNQEGGGIVRCDVVFKKQGNVFAAASYDFAYGDTLFSSAFYQE